MVDLIVQLLLHSVDFGTAAAHRQTVDPQLHHISLVDQCVQRFQPVWCRQTLSARTLVIRPWLHFSSFFSGKIGRGIVRSLL